MVDDVKKEIMKADAGFRELVKKADAAGLAELYTENACLLPTNSDIVRGRKAIKDFWGAAIKSMHVKDVELNTIDVLGTGDTVTELGSYVMKVQPPGSKVMEDKGKYVVLWKKSPKGWQLHWDIWNTSLPPAQ